ncbi:DUF2399 domain-containing protein [Pseudogracilibacillus sp. SE30717A]|uniref:DUF2399 domain-containing protein n=1 Tax=Pseudogracilibacillus sp. SE30717A TaxID=3098293 RepID=UPI00300E3A56
MSKGKSLSRKHSYWVVENSGVCASLLNHIPNALMICTNDPFTLATLLLIDFLVAEGNILFYVVDFDSEALGMA